MGRQPLPGEESRCVFLSGAHTRGQVEQYTEKKDGSWKNMADISKQELAWNLYKSTVRKKRRKEARN